ncbi:MAG: T9SS C-terminal target domain-containing protein [Sphingobacteriales bacterium]|nr:MAG: T9SS C-terminal target domain-containing protein [Sphingobacteriales bacterium]
MFPICSYCHSLGFDSTGNVVFKLEAQTFTIQVIQQGTLASVKEINAKSSLNIFPNPAGNYASVVVNAISNSDCEIKITNMLGQEVKTLNTNAVSGINTFKFDLSELQSGNYFVTVKCGDTVLTKRFVK